MPNIIAQFRFQSQPVERLQVHVREPVGESRLARSRLEPPVCIHSPIDQVLHSIFALGLQLVSQREAQNVSAVNRVYSVKVGELNWQQPRRGQHRVELRQLPWR